MSEISLKNCWKLVAIKHDEASPMMDHGAMELAVDIEQRVIYAHELLIVTYGLSSVTKACDKYIQTKQQEKIA